MVAKFYKHLLTGKVALIDSSVGEHPNLGKHLVAVEYEDDKTVIEREPVVDCDMEAKPKATRKKKAKE